MHVDVPGDPRTRRFSDIHPQIHPVGLVKKA